MMKRTDPIELCSNPSGTTQNWVRHKQCAGTTLIEAVVALSLFAVFMTGTCKLLVSHRKILDMASDRYTSANIAKNRLELVRTFGFEQIPDFNELAVTVDSSGIPSQQLGNFSRTTTITTIHTNLYELAINVKIRNRRTLAFDNAGETINTYVSKHL